MRSIFDASFQYTPSYDTDLRRTFERLRREVQGAGAGPKPRVKLHVGEAALTQARTAVSRRARDPGR